MDTREVIDAESRILRHVHWEHARTRVLDFRILEPFLQCSQPHCFHHLRHENLDEDATATGRLVFVHVDTLKACPIDCVRREKMPKEPCNVSKAIGFVAVNSVVVGVESLFKGVGPDAIKSAKALSDQAIERRIRALLGTTLDNHVDEFNL